MNKDEREDELDRIERVFARTLRFLERCAEDPQAAMASENPRDLMRELEALRDGPPRQEIEPDEVESEPRTIPLRRRKSA